MATHSNNDLLSRYADELSANSMLLRRRNPHDAFRVTRYGRSLVSYSMASWLREPTHHGCQYVPPLS